MRKQLLVFLTYYCNLLVLLALSQAFFIALANTLGVSFGGVLGIWGVWLLLHLISFVIFPIIVLFLLLHIGELVSIYFNQ